MPCCSRSAHWWRSRSPWRAATSMMLPVWAGVASLIVQTHVAYVYAVGALAVVVAVALALQLRAGRGDEPWGSVARRVVRAKAFLWTIGVLVLAWIQPLWEQLFGAGEGNLQRLATHAGEGDLTVGGGTAVKIVSAVVALPPWWARGGFEDSIRNTPLTETADGPRLFVPDLPSPAVAVVALAGRGRPVDRLDRGPAARRSATGAHGLHRVARDARRRRRRAERAGGHSHRPRQPSGAVAVRVVGDRPRQHSLGRRGVGGPALARSARVRAVARRRCRRRAGGAHDRQPSVLRPRPRPDCGSRGAGHARAHLRRHRSLRPGRAGRLRHRQPHAVRAVQHGGDDAAARARHRVPVQRRADAAPDGGAIGGSTAPRLPTSASSSAARRCSTTATGASCRCGPVCRRPTRRPPTR